MDAAMPACSSCSQCPLSGARWAASRAAGHCARRRPAGPARHRGRQQSGDVDCPAGAADEPFLFTATSSSLAVAQHDPLEAGNGGNLLHCLGGKLDRIAARQPVAHRSDHADPVRQPRFDRQFGLDQVELSSRVARTSRVTSPHWTPKSCTSLSSFDSQDIRLRKLWMALLPMTSASGCPMTDAAESRRAWRHWR